MRIYEGEYNKYEKGTKKGEMKSHLNELENNKLVRIKSELERIILLKDLPCMLTLPMHTVCPPIRLGTV